MDVRKCKKCNRLFQYTGDAKCPECIKELDRQFEEVKEILYKDPNCSREELCEKTGADEEDILYWLREGRLTLGEDSDIALRCSVCGDNIKSGRFCDSCKQNMVSKLERGANAMVKENPNIFHRNNDNTDKSKSRMYTKN